MTQQQQTTQTQEVSQVPEATTKITPELQALAQSYFDLNTKANEAKKLADNARKQLHVEMMKANINTVEVSGAFIDRFAKESTEIDPLKVKDYLDAEAFWDAASFTKKSLESHVTPAIMDVCSVTKVAKENVHVRKK